MNSRIQSLILKMEKQNQKQAFVTDKKNIFYLTGLPPQFHEYLAGLYINVNGTFKLYCYGMFKTEFYEQDLLRQIEVIYCDDHNQLFSLLNDSIDPKSPLALEDKAPVELVLALLDVHNDMSFFKLSPLLYELRMIKDTKEIGFVKKAVTITDAVMHEWLQLVDHPISEQNAAFVIKELFALNEVYDLSLEPLVAFGMNTGSMFHRPTKKYSSESELIMVRMGCKIQNYCSDITRNFFFGETPSLLKNLYNVVYEAQQRAIELIKPGIPIYMIDQVVRHFIKQCGYDDYLIHHIGHGIGLDLFEPPFITSDNALIIQPNMILALGPSIYIPGKLGLRLTDIIVVTNNGCEVITQSPKIIDTIPAYKEV
jgi:Xaa-Pro dipeptidase